ncbi:MAG TPA: DUF1587 domain-containing protein, partial [Planctomycetaceae bacterium]|nr:DUF1587 domain-containing protein [Planctomycetaceae bacterium]
MKPWLASIGLMLGLCAVSLSQGDRATAEKAVPVATAAEDHLSSAAAELIGRYCRDCHSGNDPSGGLDLTKLQANAIASDLAAWEKLVRKLRAGQMPPADAEQPPDSTVAEVLTELERSLDEYAKQHPQPGRTETFRRLTRAEYKNAIRDLLDLDIDVASLLPADEVSHGFDNITVGELSPSLLNRYISAAQKISQLAVGRTPGSPGGHTYRVKPDVTQEHRMQGLPLGTRGGTLISHTFPQDGEYEISIRLTRDRNEEVEGLSEPHELELLLDLARVKLFTVKPPRNNGKSSDEYSTVSHANVDRHLSERLRIPAGRHDIGATFLKNPFSLLETKRQPLNVHYNMYRHPRLTPAIYQVSIVGPFEADGPGETPSRERIFVTRPTGPEDDEACA